MSFSVRCSSPFNSNSHAKPFKASTPTKIVAFAIGIIAMTVGLLITFGVITALGPLSSPVGWSLFGGGALLFLLGSLVKCVKTPEISDSSSEIDDEPPTSKSNNILNDNPFLSHENSEETSSEDSNDEGSSSSSRESVDPPRKVPVHAPQTTIVAKEAAPELTRANGKPSLSEFPKWMHSYLVNAPHKTTTALFRLEYPATMRVNKFNFDSPITLISYDIGLAIGLKGTAKLCKITVPNSNSTEYKIDTISEMPFWGIVAKELMKWKLFANENASYESIFLNEFNAHWTALPPQSEYLLDTYISKENNLQWLLKRLFDKKPCFVISRVQSNTSVSSYDYWDIQLN